MKLSFYLNILLIGCFVGSCFGQDNHGSDLFLHIDKTVYEVGETALFTGYWIDSTDAFLSNRTLEVVLVDPLNKIVQSKRFLMQAGIVKGNLFLPDSLQGGLYKLLAYTSSERLREIQPVFVQAIRINGYQTNESVKPKSKIEDSKSKVLDMKQSITEKCQVVIKSDSDQYHPNSKVTLHIQIIDDQGKGIPGVFSLGTVQSKRIDPELKIDIVNYLSRVNIVNLYSLKLKPSGAALIGQVLRYGKKLKKPMPLLMMGESVNSFFTDSKGRFMIPDSLRYGKESSMYLLSIADKSQQEYCNLLLKDPRDSINRLLVLKELPAMKYANNLNPFIPDYFDATVPAQQQLREVVIKGTVKEPLDQFRGEYNSKNCDQDYVCQQCGDEIKFLNCPHHTKRWKAYKPVEGARYMYIVELGGKFDGAIYVTYHCKNNTISPFMKEIDPVIDNMDATSLNYIANNSQIEQLNTTVYWNYLIHTDENGEANITFKTNDLKGRFLVDLQGLTRLGPISGTTLFDVY
jgi:hypothetical protein